jgi:hypothetical protein
MYLNHFETTTDAKLNQLLSTLKNVHGITFDMDLSVPDADKSLLECQKEYENLKNKIIAESKFNSYQQNPDYVKSILILEAINIMLKEIAPRRLKRKKVAESDDQMEANVSHVKPMLSTQLSDISAKIKTTDEPSAAFSNMLSSIADRFEHNEPLDGDEKTVWDWIRSLPRPINVKNMVSSGIEQFGHDLALKRKNMNDMLPSIGEEEVKVSEEQNPLKTFKRKNVRGLYNYDHFEDEAGNFVQVRSDRKKFVHQDKSTGDRHEFDNIEDLKSHLKGSGRKSISESVAMGSPAVAATAPVASGSVIGQAHHYEYQASMARSELYRNSKYAMSMLKQVDPQSEVSPWIAGALTKAANYLDKVYHYLDYYKKFEPEKLPEGMDDNQELGETSGGITRQHLMMIMEYSIKLFDMIRPGDKLEGWVAMKLTTASECVSSCKHYMDYVQFENHAMDDHFSEGMKSKRSVKESTLMLEQEDLAKASTILAAKDMSNKLQDIAEDLAKMSVEDLMPLVDIMRGQFGPEAATGFNSAVKASLDKLLDLTTTTKEEMDVAINTLNSGGVPSETTDIETADNTGEPEVDVSTDNTDISKDIEALAATDTGPEEEPEGPVDEPLGRTKKADVSEGVKVGTKVNVTNPKATPRHEVTKVEDGKVTVKSPDGKTMTFPMDRIMRANPSLKEGKNQKPDFLDVDGDGNKEEPMKTALKDKEDKKVDEAAPPGKKAEEFIKANKEAFNKRYGKKGESVLYATAWKKFGKKTESYLNAENALKEAKENIKMLDAKMKAHMEEFQKSISESSSHADPLGLGYGLEGDLIIKKIKKQNAVIERARATMKNAIEEGVREIISDISLFKKSQALEEAKNSTPYGVIYKTKKGRKAKKMFESADARLYWMELRGQEISDPKMIDPEVFDKAIERTIERR